MDEPDQRLGISQDTQDKIDSMSGNEEEEKLIDRIEDIGAEVVEDLIILEKKIVSPRTASFLLLAAAVLGLLSALIILDEETPTFEAPSVKYNNIAGYVQYQNGTGIEGAEVSLVRTKYATFTSSEGYYVLEKVPSTDYALKFSKEGYKDVLIYIEIAGDRPMAFDVTLQPGTGVIVRDERAVPVEIYETNFLFGVMITMASVAAMVAAVLAFTMRSFTLSVAGAGIGVLSYGFLIGSGLALIALIFILLSRTEFIRARYDRPSREMYTFDR